MFEDCEHLSSREFAVNLITRESRRSTDRSPGTTSELFGEARESSPGQSSAYDWVFAHFNILGKLLLTAEERDMDSGIKLKFWTAWQMFAASAEPNWKRGDREAWLGYINVNFAPTSLLTVAQKLYDYQYTRTTLERGIQGKSEALHLQRPYQQIVLAFIYASKSSGNYSSTENILAARRCFGIAERYLRDSFYETLSTLPSVHLSTREAVNAEGLLALVVRSATYSVLPAKRDIIRIYGDLLSSLVRFNPFSPLITTVRSSEADTDAGARSLERRA